ncbi:MAG: hypothetical protein A4E48_02015 [Methanosaeta sp. PtaU1.Bin060]|nr:MAG: hypothetical protein A4E48_02015 [Methanosaeta sp. PtaU1.Bin060]
MAKAKGIDYRSESTTNMEIAKILYDIGELLELRGDSKFKSNAYKKASNSIEFLTEDVEAVYNQGHLRNIPGVGIATERMIIEYIQKGCVEYYESLGSEILPESKELLRISCISPKINRLLYKNLKISNIEDLLSAAKQHQIQALIGYEGEAEIIRIIDEMCKEKSLDHSRLENSLGRELTQLCFLERNRVEGLHFELISKLQKFLNKCGYNATREYPISFKTVRRRDLKEYIRRGYIDLYAEPMTDSDLSDIFQKKMHNNYPAKIAIEFDSGIRLKYKSIEKLIQSEVETCFGIVKGNNQYADNELIMLNKERFQEVWGRLNLFNSNFYLVIIENGICYDLTC